MECAISEDKALARITLMEVTMKRLLQTLTVAGTIALFGVGSVIATPTDDPGIKAGEQKQQKKIDQGVQSGKLTQKETGKLEAEQAKIKQDEVKKKSDGKMGKKKHAKPHKKHHKAKKHTTKEKHNKESVKVN